MQLEFLNVSFALEVSSGTTLTEREYLTQSMLENCLHVVCHCPFLNPLSDGGMCGLHTTVSEKCSVDCYHEYEVPVLYIASAAFKLLRLSRLLINWFPITEELLLCHFLDFAH